MKITIHPFACHPAGVGVSITVQEFPVDGGLGDDRSYVQRDFACSHEDQCAHRHGDACLVHQRNAGS